MSSDSSTLVRLAGSEAILESLPVGVTIVEAATRKIVFRNREALSLVSRTGIKYDGTDLAAHMDFRSSSGRPLEPHELPGEASLEKGEEVRDLVFSAPCLDGSRMTISLNSAPIRSEEGVILGAILTFREVRDEVRATEKLVQTERSLAATKRRRQFLTFLGETVRHLDDAATIVEVTTRLTGSHLQVERCSYGTIDVDNDSARIFRGFVSEGKADDEGIYRLTDFGEGLLERAKSGQTDVIRDASDDPRTRDHYETGFALVGIRAIISVPLIKGGRLVGLFIVNQSEPREWTSDEVRLVEEVADRSWNAIERVNTQRKVADKEAQYRTLIEELPQLAWTALPDGTRDYLSPQWCVYTGVPEEGGLGNRWLRAVHPEDRAATERRWAAAVGDVKPYEGEYRLRRHDGEYEYFHVRAKPVYDAEGILIKWIGTNHNIHDRLVAQEVLATKVLRQQNVADAFYQIAHESSIEEILKVATGAAKSALGARAVLVRLESEGEEAVTWAGFHGEEYFSRATTEAMPNINGLAVRVGKGYRAIKVDVAEGALGAKLRNLGLGDVFTSGATTAMVAPLQDWDGRSMGIVLVFSEEGGRIELEEGAVLVQFAQMISAAIQNHLLTTGLETRVAERTALLMQKVEELESFSYIVSHDLRAPLRSIVGNARLVLLDEGERVSEEGKEMLNRLARAAVTMSQLVDDLLEYARLGTKQPVIENVDVARLAESVASDVKDEYPQATIQVEIPAGHRSECDPRLIGLVLRNLFDNACKYSKVDEAPVVRVGLDEEGYFVRDRGIGFDMAYVGKLFQPFSRLHGTQKFSGTGIGLANVRRILERHGGRVWVESSLGEGSTFHFTLRPDSEREIEAAA